MNLLDVPLRPVLGRIKRAVIPPHRVPAALEDRLLFRFGYLCYAAAEPPRGDALWARLSRNWRKTRCGDLVLLTHPEAQLAVAGGGARFTVLIGNAFVASGSDERPPLDILDAADADGLPEVLDRLSGSFAVIAARDGRTSIYHDALGSRTMFYRRAGAFAVASHPEIFFHSFGDGRRPDMMDLIGSTWFGSMPRAFLPTDATIFDGVYALLPNQRYDVDRRVVRRIWPRRPRQSGRSFDAFFPVFDEYLRALANHVRDRRTVLAITGGIDSRLLIASLRHYDVPFRTVTWTTFNYQEWEGEPIRQVMQQIGGEHVWVDGSNDSINDTARIGARNSGNYRWPSPAVAGMSRLYGREAKAFWIPGIGAGAIRSTAEVKALTPDGIIDYFLERTDAGRFQHRAFVTREITAMLERVDFELPLNYGYRPGDLYNWEQQATWSGCSINAIRTAVDAMLGYSTRSVAEAAYELPDDVRCTKKLFADTIARYDPDLAAIYYQ